MYGSIIEVVSIPLSRVVVLVYTNGTYRRTNETVSIPLSRVVVLVSTWYKCAFYG